MKKHFILPATVLAWREVLRFIRQPSRVAGVLGTALLFWLFLGTGLGSSFKSDGQDYLSFSFAGMLALVVLFSSIFSMMTLIQDRNDGFLQGVLVAPIWPAALVVGKVMGAVFLALIQAGAFLVLAPWAGYSLSFSMAAASLAVLFFISFSMASLGFAFAWRINSIQGFHGVMNIVLMPMWFLSGALFPVAGAPSWLKALMLLNPLQYGVELLKWSLQLGLAPAQTNLGFHSPFSIPTLLGLFLSVCLVFFAGAVGVTRRRTI